MAESPKKRKKHSGQFMLDTVSGSNMTPKEYSNISKNYGGGKIEIEDLFL